MGYQALLFCPDEKIARTVTQVLSELEFTVESSVEPFAAVKKLMAEHFDAVVVDCDNDQNASLLFKSARNSAINQASLAVAVVEGQAGVAKAFRIGANLVLTKPINVEQAKGTLRVARGLLRKGDAAKPSAPVATTPVPPKPASTVPAAPARPATLAAATAVKPRPAAPPISKPAASVPAKPLIQTTVAAAASSANPAAAKAATETAGAQQAVKSGLPADSATKPPSTLNTASASSQSGSGAASAPAPAREVVAPASEAAAPGESKSTASLPTVSPDKTYSEKIAVESVAAEKPADAISADTNPSASTAAESAASTSTFTFGGANLPEKSENAGSKKIFLGIAAVVFLVCAIYFGWTQLHDSVPAAAPTQTSSAPTKAPAPAQPASVRPSAASATASSPGMQTALPQSQGQIPDRPLAALPATTPTMTVQTHPLPIPSLLPLRPQPRLRPRLRPLPRQRPHRLPIPLLRRTLSRLLWRPLLRQSFLRTVPQNPPPSCPRPIPPPPAWLAWLPPVPMETYPI
jgi:CheY-like chemotaxis protein